MMKKKLF